ncbi:hypothetical protein G6011_03889 [Alternaria panax]|uniref:AAA+ ATPase domain-containing protein n=1 Tax=Alternaria panax TaxID=48097 RepID=A0AAD4NTP7_9PLEO|nr:hypothetical protein G6011_03889 [Alternaria panax]
MACAVLNAARVQIPVVLDALLNQKSEQSRKLRRFHGEREVRAISGELSPLAGKTQGSFWHNGTRFTLELQRPETTHKEKEKTERMDNRDFFARTREPLTNMTVRCWGHSREPITALFEDLKKRISESTKLTVVKMQAGKTRQSHHKKRLLSTIDIDLKMMQDIVDDVELFFHKDFQSWYENSGGPYRHNYLFAGPPGSGKSSLLAGIASHMNVPLYLLNLQDMDDNDLREAFSRVPFRSCIGLDIDCVDVNVSNRGAQKPILQSAPKEELSDCATSQMDQQLPALETLMTQFMRKQATANSKVLDQVKAIKSATFEYLCEDAGDSAPVEGKKSTDRLKKRVTLSGLLNVIDGVNATEGRLIIMTTNHHEKLDLALYRAGRVERKFDISYASQASSIMTFKRLFGNDICKRYTSEAIDRFAQAFQAQFPSKSRITTAELAKYCNQYRGRPEIAVKEFAHWLERGADQFSCPIDYTKLFNDEGIYNVPKSFDEDLLQVNTCDLIDRVSAAASGIEAASEIQATSRNSACWNPMKALKRLFLESGEYADLQYIEDPLLYREFHPKHVVELSGHPLDPHQFRSCKALIRKPAISGSTHTNLHLA